MASDPPPFDLSGSAWRTTTLAGQAIPPQNAPRLEFDWLGRPSGRGFTGCDEFGFDVTFQGGQLTVGDLVLNPSGCRGPGAELERAFLGALRAAERWSVDGDRLGLDGSGGVILLARELPPVGDPGRLIADNLRSHKWRILQAPGVVGLERLPLLQFTDTLLIAQGECGFTGTLRFGSGGVISIAEVGWDTVGCGGPDDGRAALAQLLEAVNTARPGPDGTVVLAGPQGEVVLGE